MAAFDRGLDARLQFGGERLAEVEPHRVHLRIDRLAEHRPGQSPLGKRARGEGGDAGRQRRQRPRRGVAGGRHGGKLAAGNGGDQLGDQIGLGREVAVDGAGGDTGARGDRGDLHRAHAALGGDGRRRGQDCLLPLGQTANHVLGAAIGHSNE